MKLSGVVGYCAIAFFKSRAAVSEKKNYYMMFSFLVASLLYYKDGALLIDNIYAEFIYFTFLGKTSKPLLKNNVCIS